MPSRVNNCQNLCIFCHFHTSHFCHFGLRGHVRGCGKSTSVENYSKKVGYFAKSFVYHNFCPPCAVVRAVSSYVHGTTCKSPPLEGCLFESGRWVGVSGPPPGVGCDMDQYGLAKTPGVKKNSVFGRFRVGFFWVGFGWVSSTSDDAGQCWAMQGHRCLLGVTG